MGMVLEAYWKGGPCKKSLITWMYFFIKHLVERHEGKNSTQLPDAINPHVVVIISGLSTLVASKVVSCFPHGHGELPTAGPTMPPVSWI